MSLKYAVLGLLQNNPHYGYEIKQKFENSLGEVWPISYGQLYPTLRRLTERGYITKRTESGKKAIDKNVYTITDKGKDLFREWFLKIPKKTPSSIKDEFTLLLLFIEDVEESDVVTIIEKQKSLVKKLRDRYRRFIHNMDGENQYYRRAVIKKKIFYLEAELSWLDELLNDHKLMMR
jgi:DNA-binding PadR family transcriptional regulator